MINFAPLHCKDHSDYPVNSFANLHFNGVVSKITFESVVLDRVYNDNEFSMIQTSEEFQEGTKYKQDNAGNFVTAEATKGLKSFLAEKSRCLYYFSQIDKCGGCLLQGGETLKDVDLCRLEVFYLRDSADHTFNIEALKKDMDNFVVDKVKTRNSISMVVESFGELELKPFAIKDKSAIDIGLNYGQEFVEVHERIMKFVEGGDSGLILMHGEPGNGKTYYIRHLIKNIDKTLIYVPPNMMHIICSPKFLSFMQLNQDAVLIIEDAEEILKNREQLGDSTAVSNLLNLSDGILGDILKMKIICTFNTSIDNVDKALLRKGRLFLKYEFAKLNICDTNNLLKHLNSEFVAKEGMSLSDIYNVSTDNLYRKKETKRIGF